MKLSICKICCHIVLTSFLFVSSCANKQKIVSAKINQQDSLKIVEMIKEREKGMKQKDIEVVLAQFDDNATWINSQGYFFEGRSEIRKFHAMLNGNDSLDYYYEIGNPRIRLIDNNNAIAYYSWKMFWYKKLIPTDTTYREIGLMTLMAKKDSGAWKWIAVTNQHTPWFYKVIDPVKME